MWTEASVPVAWFPVSLPVNVDLVAIRLGPRDRFAFRIAFKQRGPGDLLLHRVVHRWIEIFRVLDPHNVYTRHVASVVVQKLTIYNLLLLVSPAICRADNILIEATHTTRLVDLVL